MSADREVRTLVSAGRLRSRRGRTVYWLVFAATMTAFTVAFLLPLYWVVVGAVKSAPELAQTPPTVLPHSFEPEVYRRAWSELDLARYFGNTLLIVGGTWAVQLAVDVPAAYALSKLRPRF